jgi:hypothetical protein
LHSREILGEERVLEEDLLQCEKAKNFNEKLNLIKVYAGINQFASIKTLFSP